jgi:tRNA (cytidine/uridine-2'-O-)-methyltransferase
VIDIILLHPEIPQNTGSIGRICAFSGSRLHLIHPLGFEINDKNLRRAGLDYWNALEVFEYQNWDEFLNSERKPSRIHLFTTHAEKPLWEVEFKMNDGLLFGNEGKGAPDEIHKWAEDHRVTIPRFHDGLRSLNLAVSVGIATYEAIRQISR